MKNEQIVNSFGRILALGYRADAVSTRNIMEEIKFLARLTGNDGTQFLQNCVSKRDEILANSGVFKAATK